MAGVSGVRSAASLGKKCSLCSASSRSSSVIGLGALHKLHFFPSEAADLTPLTPAIVHQLEPILLAEPVGQPEKWLKASTGTANSTFLAALRDFMYWENYDVRVRMDGKIDRVVLQDILRKRPH